MELSTEVTDGLQLSGDSAHIPDSVFGALVESVCDDLLNRENGGELQIDKFGSVDKASLKEAYAALMTFSLECAKNNADSSNISSVLEDCKFTTERIKTFTNIFLEKKSHIQALLGSVSHNPPHIVDVDWRLDYYIKNNHVDKVNQPTYLITLKTEECGQQDTKDVQFACTMEQLQDLVGKLKDATKSLEKASQM
ncbi:COMM domain-containing protein 3 isoform X2 [Lingula anatina]|uniref:COMM domain-containing protein 3 n=1 Tax=Lingula anatina TaxID=7574 RepID=A0A1S3JFJ1_LINAN|nr:COMM domain-containing protein 3 isoform X2 [Lingula anatina]|eukprot:XP_013409182.1 COMM domain-containing protein 3 isoform X2 [Lingula anatina]